MEQLSGEMNELMSTKMCSPLMIYLAVIVTTGISVYITRDYLKRHNTTKMDNLYNIYSLQELKLMLVLGIILYGLCQYNKTNLAWIFLLLPIIYIIIQNLTLYIHVSSAVQTAPKAISEADMLLAQQTQYFQAGGDLNPRLGMDSQVYQAQEKPIIPPKIAPQQVDTPAMSRSSQVLGASGTPGGVNGVSGGSNFAFI